MIHEMVQAIVDALNSKTWSLPFTAYAVAVPDVELKDLGTIAVLVCPGANEITRLTRGLKQYDMRVDIGVAKAIGGQRNEQIKAMLALLEEIADWFLDNPPANATTMSVELNPIYDPESMRAQNGLFQAAVQLNLQSVTA